MKYTMLGNTMIPKIALGTWSWGSGPTGGPQIYGNHLEETDLRPVFQRAMHAGFTLWDTAPTYGKGAAETILGHLCNQNPNVQLSTKYRPTLFHRRSSMERSLSQSLERLGYRAADLFWVHTPEHVEQWTRELIPLMQAGRFRYVGVANHNLAEIQQAASLLEASGLRIAAVQNHYSLLYRDAERTGILRWCQTHGVVFFAYLVLEQGALSGRYTPDAPLPPHSRRGRAYPPETLSRLQPLLAQLRQVGHAHHATAAQIAIAWAIEKGTVPIVGITKPHHVTEEAEAVYLHLSPEEMRELEYAADATGVSVRGFWEQALN